MERYVDTLFLNFLPPEITCLLHERLTGSGIITRRLTNLHRHESLSEL